MKSSRLLLVISPLLVALAHGQNTSVVAAAAAGSSTGAVTTTSTVAVAATTATPANPIGTAPAVATGETSVSLDLGFGIRAVPASRITVPTGEKLRIVAPDLGSTINYVWTKNGRALSAPRGNVLTLDFVTTADAGTYVCLFSTPTSLGQSSQTLILGVGPTDRLMNLSTRATIGGGADQGLVSGFAVQASTQPKKLIVRAIGPSLSLFGVASPLAAPVLRIFDSRGQPYTNAYVYPAVVGGPTYESDLADSLSRSGAFPIPAGTRDAVMMMPFLPGNYTAQVTSGDGTAGNVLLEIYEVP